MKAMRVRVSDDDARWITTEAEASGAGEAEVVRRALWIARHFRELVVAAAGPPMPHIGPASPNGGGSTASPDRTRGSTTAPDRPLSAIRTGLILPVEESPGGAVTAPDRTRVRTAPPRARERETSRDPDPDPEEDPEEEADPSDLRADRPDLTDQQRAVFAVAELFRRCGLPPPQPVVIGFWRRQAGGTERLLAVVREVTAKGRLGSAKDPQSFMFACIQRAAADRAAVEEARAAGSARDLARARLDHARAYLHGPEESRPYHEQQLRELSGEEPLLWQPPTAADVERLEAEIYAPSPTRPPQAS